MMVFLIAEAAVTSIFIHNITAANMIGLSEFHWGGVPLAIHTSKSQQIDTPLSPLERTTKEEKISNTAPGGISNSKSKSPRCNRDV
jgi:hypothetical protein